jgi:hypothetical protein
MIPLPIKKAKEKLAKWENLLAAGLKHPQDEQHVKEMIAGMKQQLESLQWNYDTFGEDIF